jgi:hypothetical protein
MKAAAESPTAEANPKSKTIGKYSTYLFPSWNASLLIPQTLDHNVRPLRDDGEVGAEASPRESVVGVMWYQELDKG